MQTISKIIQEHDGSWWFVISYGDFGSVSFEVQYHQLDYYHDEGFPIIPNR